MVVPLQLGIKVRHLCRYYRSNALTVVLVRAVMAVTHGSFEGHGSKGASNSKIAWGHLKDPKSDFKNPSKSYISDKKVKR